MLEQVTARRLAVVGGGWAGVAGAVRASQLGWQLSLFEMAPQLGGRARSLAAENGATPLDNGQHILIGAYRDSLALMAQLGVPVDEALLRLPLRLRYPDHEGLQLRSGAAVPAFARAVLGYRSWPLRSRLQLLWHSLRWATGGFRCDPTLTVAELTRGLPRVVQCELIEPLCVAALNTPAGQASAEVFLRVLRDALFSGPGSSDLLLPRRPLSELLAEPAQRWLGQQGADIRLGQRVQSLQADGDGWQVDGEHFDAVLLAGPAREAARLTQDLAPDWAKQASGLRYEPIVTVYLHSHGSALPAPMVALQEGAQAPAQFAFDLGQLGHAPGRFAFVISGAAPWVEAGLTQAGEAVLAQACQVLRWHSPPHVLKVLAEKRATFACTPALQRPPARLMPGLWAAGDYVTGPYPATLEGAVRAGLHAAEGLSAEPR